MKKILKIHSFILIMGLILVPQTSHSQENFGPSDNFHISIDEDDRILLACVTTSCCSIFGVGIEVWSETTCHYIEQNKNNGAQIEKYAIQLGSSENINGKTLTLKEDIILAGKYDKANEKLVAPKGSYTVENNEIDFVPTAMRVTEYCYIREVNGQFLGHQYTYEINFCISFGKTSDTYGLIVMTPKLTESQLQKVKAGNNKISFNNTVQIKDSKNKLNINIKAGEYFLNTDGNIYLQHYKIR